MFSFIFYNGCDNQIKIINEKLKFAEPGV